jgi:gluconate:H+ symporter, GntP family
MLALAVQATTEPVVTASAGRLLPAALVGIALIILLITRFRMNPFLGLTIGALVVSAIAGMPMATAITSFAKGFGDTAAGVGMLIALGAMFGKLLADSGGADEIVDTLVARAGPRMLPWAMGAAGALIGLPMFFEIGLVLLMPVILLVARRSGLPLMSVGIPALAGLSVMHGLVPPHPGPLVAVDALGADLGLTLGLGVVVAVPTLIIAGPLFGELAARWVKVPAPDLFTTDHDDPAVRRPSFAVTMGTVLLPVALMLGKALADILAAEGNPVRTVLDFLGTPLIALLIAVLVAMVTLGRGAGMDLEQVTQSVEQGLPPIAGILLIVAAGGGFKQTLIDTGIGKLIADWVAGSGVSVLLLAWFIAVLIRLATGSATVATVTASGILAPLVETLSPSHTALLVLAIGSGSLFFSHVNDAGFWLVKEYFGITVWQNVKTWSVMETIISVVGLGCVLLLGLVI